LITEQKAIFNPGYTSKKRGWGLGLSLANASLKIIIKEKFSLSPLQQEKEPLSG